MLKFKRWQVFCLVLLAALVGCSSLLFFQPRWLLNAFIWLNPGAVFFAQTEDPLIALTIDDGPYPETTDEILDVLAQYGAQATFFVIGDRMPSNPTALQRIVSEGHELGNHLWQDTASAKLTPQEFETALIKTEAAIAQASGSETALNPTPEKPGWMRPGMGWYNPEMIAIAQKHHYHTALGDIFPYDTHLPSVDFATQQILWNARPGSIIVLHDGTSKRGQRTAETLRQVLPQLRQKGFRIVTLSQLFTAEIK